MPFELTVDSFLDCLKQSGLIEGDQIKPLLVRLRKQGVDIHDPRAIADGLVELGSLTRWQADNLLRGKRRGFLLGKYRLLDLLGRGGMNAVYLAEHSLMRRQCAIKVLPTTSESDRTSLERFHREGRAAALLDHTNIVRAYDFDMALDGNREVHFLVMEYVDGESLHDRVVRTGSLSSVDAANFVRQAADGLAHAHEAGVVHRDIKPANLLVDRDGIIKVLDLGLAKFFDQRPTVPRSQPELVLGTVDFVAPEQALGSQTVDARSDIYSLGCLFYFLLAGHPPFPDGTLSERLVCHQLKEPTPIIEKRPDVPADLAAILGRMMAKRPEDRIQTAAELSELLRQWLLQHADREWILKHPILMTAGSSFKAASVGNPAVRVTWDSQMYKSPTGKRASAVSDDGSSTAAAPLAPIASSAPPPTATLSDAATDEFDMANFRPHELDAFPLTRSTILDPRKKTTADWQATAKNLWQDRRHRELMIIIASALAGIVLLGALALLMR